MKYFFLVLTAIALFASCSKEPTITPSRENILRSKKWTISGGTLTVKNPSGKDTNLNYFDFITECYRDDYFQFDSLHFGKTYSSGVRCNPADPEFRNFTWRLHDDDRYIDLYNGFNNIFAVSTYIEPYRFETLATQPFLVLDTVIGRTDTTPGFTKQFIVLDTIREVKFVSYPIPKFDIYGAEIVSFSESSFRLNFSFKTQRLDSNYFHAGAPNNFEPKVLPDTADYSLIFTAY